MVFRLALVRPLIPIVVVLVVSYAGDVVLQSLLAVQRTIYHILVVYVEEQQEHQLRLYQMV
jgi:hypothetical protein